MIRKLKFNEVDWQKYEECLRNSGQYNFQGERAYLEGVNGKNWVVLIFNDYQAVMPVFVKRKFGLKFVIPPPYINQLGIFSANDDAEINSKFLEFLNKNYRVLYYPFNSKNSFKGLKKRRNFRLEKEDYEEIKKKYSVHRRRNVRLRESGLEFKEIENTAEIKDFFFAHALGMKDLKMSKNYFRVLEILKQHSKLIIYGLFRNSQMVCVATVSDFENEMALLNLINDKKNSTPNDASVLIDQILQRHINEKNFNFFGSNIDSVAEFYRRFGASEEQYSYTQNSRKKVLMQLFKSFK